MRETRPVSHATLLTTGGAAIAGILALSGSCDRAIDLRITSIRQLSLSEHSALDHRIDMLEEWRDRVDGKAKP